MVEVTTGWTKFVTDVSIVTVGKETVATGGGDGVEEGAGVGVAVGAVIVKSVLETAKEISPIASTFIRAVVVGRLGIRTDSDPSFDVLAARMVGNVLPLSVEREILTFAALIGAAVVPKPFQVTVKFANAAMLTPTLGAVTAKGPETSRLAGFGKLAVRPNGAPGTSRTNIAATTGNIFVLWERSENIFILCLALLDKNEDPAAICRRPSNAGPNS